MSSTQLDHDAWTEAGGYEDEIEETRYAVRQQDGAVRTLQALPFAPGRVGTETLAWLHEPEIIAAEYDALAGKTAL